MSKYNKIKIDITLISLFTLLITFGLINLYSTDYPDLNYFNSQIKFSIISVLISIAIIIINWRIIYSFININYLINILLLLLVLFVGDSINGSKSWLQIGQYSFQPSEFMKITTGLIIAKLISKDNKAKNIYKNIYLISLLILPMILILMQPDLGTIITFSAFIIVFFRFKIFDKILFTLLIILFGSILILLIPEIKIYLFILLGIIMILEIKKIIKKKIPAILKNILYFLFIIFAINISQYSYEKILKDYHKERINVIIGKNSDPEGAGWNLAQSKIAIGSGGFKGKGFLKGTQTQFDFIPEQQTDFIFCTIGEEWGFLGASAIIIIYLLIIWRIILLSEKNKNLIVKVYGYSIASFIFIHTFLNIGMTVGIFPTIGIPLPFMSYGGSSMLSFSIMIAIFINLNSRIKYY